VLTTTSSQPGSELRTFSASAASPITGAVALAAMTISAIPAPSAMLRIRPTMT
jgi:hypothetical protein